jgi:YHS domain-containing protein
MSPQSAPLRSLTFVLAACWLLAAPAGRPFAQESADAEEALLGFDPIVLIDGREELGKEDLSAVHEGFKYLFVSAENRARFLKDPSRYTIQLGGVCARMGGTVFGAADRYAVVNGRIYVFGTEACRTAFTAAPAKYLEPAATPLEGDRDAIARGRALLERAVEAAGGAAAVDRVEAVLEQRVWTLPGPDGVVELKGAVGWRLPDRVYEARTYGGSLYASVLAGDRGFQSGPTRIRPYRRGQRDALRRDLRRQVLVTLRERRDPTVTVVAAGRRRMGGLEVEQVDVVHDGVAFSLGLDPASGRVVASSFVGRGPGGLVGVVVRTFSDFRQTDGLTLPFTTTGTFGGEALPQESWRTTGVAFNDAVPAALFEAKGTK